MIDVINVIDNENSQLVTDESGVTLTLKLQSVVAQILIQNKVIS